MANVLLAWELGSGFGHVNRLLPIARELAGAGHRPIFVVKDLVEPAKLLSRESFPVLQAPLWHRSSANESVPFRATSYADILANLGFSNASHLLPLVEAWQRLIELTEAELIVAEHCPTVFVAASGVTPVVHVGTGFSVPPCELATFPLLQDGDDDELRKSQQQEQQVLEVVREVQRQRGRPEPETLPSLFAHSKQFVLTWPELDPYREVRRRPASGPMLRFGPRGMVPETPRFFAYLSAEYPGIDQILASIVAAGLAGEVFLRRVTPAMRRQLKASGVTVHENPQVLADVLARVTVILHHGGIGVAGLAMSRGCPQLILPLHLEHTMTGDALERFGIGRSLHGTIRISQIVQAAMELSEEAFTSAAAEFAQRLSARNPQSPLQQIIKVCEEAMRVEGEAKQ